MGRHKKVCDDVKLAAVRMARVMSPQEVAVLLDISDDTVRRSVKQFEMTGSVVATASGAKRGRKAILNEDDKAVSTRSSL